VTPLHRFTLTTPRLTIRPFTLDDFDAIRLILDAGFGEAPVEDRRFWLDWNIRNYDALAAMMQPPYGDYAVVLTESNTLVGSVGIVPSMAPFDKLPYFRERSAEAAHNRWRPEVGLFWVVAPQHQRQGIAAEAAQAMIHYLFTTWHLQRIVATTEYDNAASQAVMRRIGMRVEQNPDGDPAWFQVVGIIEHP
jgi:RimJ/RimL family protein N-acetyltransferase